MNLSAPFLSQFFTEPLLAAIPYVDFMFGNESEAEAFGEKQGFEDKSVKNVALQLAKMDKVNSKRPRTVVITQGADCTVVATPDGTVTEYSVPKLAKEDIVDANGAGDSFVGGFLAGLMKGKSIKECVDAGHYAASVILKVTFLLFAACAFIGPASLNRHVPRLRVRCVCRCRAAASPIASRPRHVRSSAWATPSWTFPPTSARSFWISECDLLILLVFAGFVPCCLILHATETERTCARWQV